ncbi:unnamed protein product [Medioppia subpectinata]|uniref:Uncharacterized protein n=1 Tax=Medioppia subpectinata TaxID=1979941 RepID=A0A7R9KEA3_9ACAR|nr:unnamed protein product [Medioppia subpectinata]CAG2101759.1 unnamed protein product [Medioppia subpectinata]
MTTGDYKSHIPLPSVPNLKYLYTSDMTIVEIVNTNDNTGSNASEVNHETSGKSNASNTGDHKSHIPLPSVPNLKYHLKIKWKTYPNPQLASLDKNRQTTEVVFIDNNDSNAQNRNTIAAQPSAHVPYYTIYDDSDVDLLT